MSPDVEIYAENWKRLGSRYLPPQSDCRHWIDNDSFTIATHPSEGPVVNFRCEECGAVAELNVVELINAWGERNDVPWEAM